MRKRAESGGHLDATLQADGAWEENKRDSPADAMGVYFPIDAPFSKGRCVCDGDVHLEGLWHLPLVIFRADGGLREIKVPLGELKDGLSPKLDLIPLNGWKSPVTWAYACR